MEHGINFLPLGMEGKKAGNYGIRRLTFEILWIERVMTTIRPAIDARKMNGLQHLIGTKRRSMRTRPRFPVALLAEGAGQQQTECSISGPRRAIGFEKSGVGHDQHTPLPDVAFRQKALACE
jgi:hypothetical protein